MDNLEFHNPPANVIQGKRNTTKCCIIKIINNEQEIRPQLQQNAHIVTNIEPEKKKKSMILGIIEPKNEKREETKEEQVAREYDESHRFIIGKIENELPHSFKPEPEKDEYDVYGQYKKNIIEEDYFPEHHDDDDSE